MLHSVIKGAYSNYYYSTKEAICTLYKGKSKSRLEKEVKATPVKAPKRTATKTLTPAIIKRAYIDTFTTPIKAP